MSEKAATEMPGHPDLAERLAIITPGLETNWDSYFSDSPTNQPKPTVEEWVDLLQSGASRPWEISDRLSKLLRSPKSGPELQHGWVLLSNLFAVTFEAAKSMGDDFDPIGWQNLLEIQNRIQRHAAQLLVREDRPDTAALSRRALYLQTITDLNKKIVDIWDPDELLDQVVNVIQQNLDYEYVNLYRLDKSEQTLTLQNAIWNGQHPRFEVPIRLKVDTQGLVNRVAATGRAVLVEDVSQEPTFSHHPALPTVRSALAVPLIAGKNLVGVLEFSSEQAHAVVDDDRQIGQALADHVAVAMENARLQNALQRHLREKTLLYESNLALGTSLDLERVLKLMTQKIAEAVDAGACVICHVDKKAHSTIALAQYVYRFPGNPPRTWRKLNQRIHISKDPIGQQTLRTIRPVIGRVDPDKPPDRQPVWSRIGVPGEAATAQKPGWGVVLALPMEIEGRVIGLLEIYDRNPHRNFSNEDIQLCRILATQTSLAMEQARLFGETRQRLNEVATLYTMAQKIAGNLELQAVLDTIVVTLRQAVGCRGCCIFLIDQTGVQLEIKAAAGLKAHWRETAKLAIGEGIAGRAAAERRTISVADTRQDPTFVVFDEEVRSLVVTPLYAHGEVIGTINVDSDLPNAFGPTQERLLTIAATQAGMVIDNARLFAKVATEEQQTRAIIQHMADGLLLINGEGEIVTCNQTLAMMLGLHPGQITGQKVGSSQLPPNLAMVTATATQLARTGVLAKEISIDTPRPTTLQIFSTKIVDDDHRPMGEVRVVHDITRERELEQLKDEFFSMISHDLRTPLFSIHGFAQILLDDGEELDTATRTEFLTTIQRQVLQLTDMVNNLLDLNRLNEGKFELMKEPVVIADLVHQIILKLQGFAHQSQVRLRSNMSPTLPVVSADKERLEQVLTNLIGNGIKFTEADGEVIVSAAKIDNEIQIDVADSGMGIPPEELEQIFSRYYQAEHHDKRLTKGSGLGLHISQKIVEAHGGRIWAESVVNQGSIFRFTLPL